MDLAAAAIDTRPRSRPSARQLLVRRLRDLIRLELTGVDRTTRLPSEAELMTRYDAPRDAIRDALALLADEGLLERRRGLGTLPLGSQHQLSALLPTPGSTLEDSLRVGRISPRLLQWGWVRAPATIAHRLDSVQTGEDVLCVDYVLLHDDLPLGVITNYLRSAEAERLQPADFRTDFYTLLASGGCTVDEHDIVLQATVADEHVATLLHVLPGEPVLWFEQRLRDLTGAAVDLAVAHLRREVRLDFTAVPRMDLLALTRPPGVVDSPG